MTKTPRKGETAGKPPKNNHETNPFKRMDTSRKKGHKKAKRGCAFNWAKFWLKEKASNFPLRLNNQSPCKITIKDEMTTGFLQKPEKRTKASVFNPRSPREKGGQENS